MRRGSGGMTQGAILPVVEGGGGNPNFGEFVQITPRVWATGVTSFEIGAAMPANVTAGNMLVLAVCVQNGTERAVTVTSNSTPDTFVQAGKQLSADSAHWTYIYHGLNQVGGVKPTITFSVDGATTDFWAFMAEYEASDLTSLDRTASDADSTSTAEPNSGTTALRTAAKELQIGVASLGAFGGYWETMTGGNLRSPDDEYSRVCIGDILRLSAGTEGVEFTFGGSDWWACLTATYKDE